VTSHRADKTYEIGRHYEKYRKCEAARWYYRQTVLRYPGTAAAEQAQGRLAALGEFDEEQMATTEPSEDEGT
jgi:TolA-binding protein